MWPDGFACFLECYDIAFVKDNDVSTDKDILKTLNSINKEGCFYRTYRIFDRLR